MRDPKEQIDQYCNPTYREVKEKLLEALLSWRGDIVDVDFLLKNTKGVGPVARRAARHTRSMKGTDSEERLNKMVEKIDAGF